MTSFILHLETAETENNNKDFQLIKKYINKNSVALDIGACIGNFTRFLAKHSKTVFAFEPSPFNYAKLIENTKDLKNVAAFEIAIRHKESFHKTLYLCPNDIGMNRLYPSKWCIDGLRVTNVVTRRIDDLGIKNINFVKIDVEGYEYYVIKGMKNLIKRDHPIILMEFHPPSMEEAGSDPSKLYHFMMDIGYKYPIIVHDQRIKIKSYTELDNICRNKPAVNILFIHNNN